MASMRDASSDHRRQYSGAATGPDQIARLRVGGNWGLMHCRLQFDGLSSKRAKATKQEDGIRPLAAINHPLHSVAR